MLTRVSISEAERCWEKDKYSDKRWGGIRNILNGARRCREVIKESCLFV